jgi:sugar phosphate isomerase/epimerase
MKIGTQSAAVDRIFGPEKALSVLKGAGFEAVDFPLDNEVRLNLPYPALKKYFTDIGKYAADSGLEIGQTHAPFYGPDKYMTQYDEVIEIQKRAIAATSFLGSEYVVIHPIMTKERKYNNDYERNKEIILKYYTDLIPTLKEYGVYLAVENMFSWDSVEKCICPTACTTAEEMAEYIDELGERFVACLDIGHINLIHQKGYEHVNFAHMIKTLGHRIKTLHVHDNDGINDEHLPPFAGNIDWNLVMTCLKGIGYSGNLSLEADNFMTYFRPEQFEKGQKVMYANAKRLYDMFVQGGTK